MARQRSLRQRLATKVLKLKLPEQAVSSAPMHLLFLTHYFPPEGNAPATRVFELGRRWVRSGHEVTVITSAPNVPNGRVYPGYRNRCWEKDQVEGLEVVRVWTYLAPNRGSLRRILNFISFMVTSASAALFVRKPDLVLATSPQFFCGWAGALVSKLRRRPFILEVRDLWPEAIQAVGAMRNRAVLRFLEWLERRLYASADHIVTVGEGYFEKLKERGVPAEKISIVMNGADGGCVQAEARGREIRKCYGLDGHLVCAYIGTVGMACGLEVVVRAARQLKAVGDAGVRFLVVGDGAALDELKRSVAAFGLDNVILTGGQPKKRVADFLAAADACLVHLKKHPLFATVMPSKIFEALAMNRPVILGVAGYAAQFIQRSGGGICIEPENEGELLSAIERLRREPKLGETLGRRGQRYVLEHFDWDKLAARYLEIVEEVKERFEDENEHEEEDHNVTRATTRRRAELH